jgi:hypothetical protein
MLRGFHKYIITTAILFQSCIPLEYVEPSADSFSEAQRSPSTRSFYHDGLNKPIQIDSNNGVSKGRFIYDADDPYIDVIMRRESNAIREKNVKEEYSSGYSLEQVSTCFDYYISAQKSIIEDELNNANVEIDAAIEVMPLQQFYDLKGSIYFLAGDSATADYYWNYLK